jgi:hypothetical protein
MFVRVSIRPDWSDTRVNSLSSPRTNWNISGRFFHFLSSERISLADFISVRSALCSNVALKLNAHKARLYLHKTGALHVLRPRGLP